MASERAGSVSWSRAGRRAPVEHVSTLWTSFTRADGFAFRPSCRRTRSHSRPVSWAKTVKTQPFCHLAT